MRKFKVNQHNLSDIFSNAFYASPWFQIDWDEDEYNAHWKSGYCLEDTLANMIMHDKTFQIIDVEFDKTYNLTKDMMQKGFDIVKDKFPRHYADFVEENDDFYTNDAFVQCALFGDIIYC